MRKYFVTWRLVKNRSRAPGTCIPASMRAGSPTAGVLAATTVSEPCVAPQLKRILSRLCKKCIRANARQGGKIRRPNKTTGEGHPAWVAEGVRLTQRQPAHRINAPQLKSERPVGRNQRGALKASPKVWARYGLKPTRQKEP